MGDILAFGSVVIDNVLVVNRFAAANETVQARRYRYTYGGAGANVAVASARLGLRSGIFAVSGYDFGTTNYRKCLKEQGIDIRGVIRTNAFPMPRSFIISKNRSGDQRLYYYENKRGISNLLFQNESLALKLSKEYELLHFSTGHFEFYYRFLKHNRVKNIVSFDPGQETFTYAYRVIRLLKFANLLFMNKYEAKRVKEILRIKNIREIKGPKLICVSLGAYGSIIVYNGQAYCIPAVKPTNLVDPTGAGDSHRAGFLVALLKGYDFLTAGRIASTVASFTIEAEGAQTSLPNWENVVRRYEHFFNEKFPKPQTNWKETKKFLLS